jgi:uncharacterized membrane protein
VRYAGRLGGLARAGRAVAGLMITPAWTGRDRTGQVSFARVQRSSARCVQCHSAKPTDDQFVVAPSNVMFDTAERIQAMAARIKDRVYTNQTMPFLNKTKITPQERAELGAWVDQGAKLK